MEYKNLTTMKDKEKFIKMLNYGLNYEYTDFFTYRKESAMMQKKIVSGEKLADEFIRFSNMELRHADILSNKIVELGFEPIWQMENIFYNDSLRETLLRHIEKENLAYKFYTELQKINTDLTFEIVIKGIQQDEKEHLNRLTNLFKKIGN